MSLAQFFPKLGNDYSVTSHRDRRYNCIAWAAGVKETWWQPDEHGIFYWPPDIPRQYTLEAYVEAFATLGYEVCDNDYLEDGYEKVAIFVEGNSPEHVARQLSSGRWTSKLGMLEDIEHALQGLSGEKYGEVVKVLKRRRERSEV